MAFDPKAVANYFLELARRDGESLSPMRLIKLVYIAHGWHYGLLHKPLINEHPEAWRYGPVVPSLYHEFKEFGNEPITRPAMDFDVGSTGVGSFELRPHAPPTSSESSESCALMDAVWSSYRPFNALQLSEMTHRPGTPWYITWHERGGKEYQGTDIDPKLIEDHYKEAARGGGQ